jgi:RHS repeat-associated protein
VGFLAANDAHGQTCSAPTPAAPQVTSQDGQEGVSQDAPPDVNTTKDPDVPAAQSQPAPTGQTSGGDHGDGAGANGTPGGTDSSGGDSDDSASFDSISGFETVTSFVGFNPGGGEEQLHHAMADPIDVVTADKKHVQVDYVSLGANPVRMARSYHSNAAQNPAVVTVPMGIGWHMFYDRTLQQISSSHIRLNRANGTVVDFLYNGSTWTSPLVTGVLTQISGGWAYYNQRDTIETYNASGQLIGMSDSGLITQMQYDVNGRLVRASNAFGRALTFGYDSSGRLSTVGLPDSTHLTYGYDGYNNLASVSFSDGSVRQYLYENSTYRNALTGVIDESGRRRLTWTYDSAGRPSGAFYGTNVNATTISYNGSQVVTTDARGTQRTRNLATIGGQVVVSSMQTAATANSAATSWSFGYDASGNMQNVVTRSGQAQQIGRDARGRRNSQTWAVGSPQAITSTTTWHPTFNVPTQTVVNGVTTNYTVDTSGRITQITSVSGSSTIVSFSAVYNAQNLLQSTTDARGTTLSYTYDSSGNVASLTNSSLGQTTYYSGYNAHGQPTTIQRPDGTTVTRSFDTRGRIVSRTDPDGTSSYTYDPAGRVVRVTAPDGSWTSRSYDSAGLLSSVSNNRGETTNFTRDAAGAVTQSGTYSASGVLTAQSKRTIDPVGRTASVIDSRGYATQFLYGSDGRPTGATNPLGLTKTIQLDPLNRPLAVTQPNTTAMRQAGGAATTSSQFSYTASNKPLSVVDTQSVATGYNYDAFNRRLSEAGNDAGGIGVVRNAAGDVTSHTDPLGTTLGLTRDAIGRVTAITYAGSPDRTFSYVAGRSDGLLSGITDSFGSSENWTYDSAGRMLTQQQNVYGLQQTLSVARDTLGRPTSITYPSGTVVGISYSADIISGMTVNGATLLNNIAYLPQTNIATSWRWGNGASYARAFDADGRVTSVSLGTVQRSYGYDAAGNITNQTDTGPAGTLQSTFSYDEAGQLIGYNTPSQSMTYTYDTNGNRQSQAGTLGSSGYTYLASSNRISSGAGGTYQYNADGTPNTNLAPLQYNFYGQLSQLSSSKIRSLSNFNALGQRDLNRYYQYVNCSPGGGAPNVVHASAETNSVSPAATCTNWPLTHVVRYVYDEQSRLIGEYDSVTGYSQETIWFNSQPVATVINGTIYYVNADNIGAPRSIVRATDNVEMWRWDSDPFGSIPPTTPNPAAGTIVYNLRFPGQVATTGVPYYQNGARDYSPVTGRYIQPDPTGLAGGLSRYAYAKGNPLSNTDATGLVTVFGSGGYQWVPFVGGKEANGGYYWSSDSSGAFSSQGTDNAGLLFGAGVTLGYTLGDTNDFSGPFTNWNLQTPFFSLNVYWTPAGKFMGLGIGWGPGIGAAQTKTVTACTPS